MMNNLFRILFVFQLSIFSSQAFGLISSELPKSPKSCEQIFNIDAKLQPKSSSRVMSIIRDIWTRYKTDRPVTDRWIIARENNNDTIFWNSNKEQGRGRHFPEQVSVAFKDAIPTNLSAELAFELGRAPDVWRITHYPFQRDTMHLEFDYIKKGMRVKNHAHIEVNPILTVIKAPLSSYERNENDLYNLILNNRSQFPYIRMSREMEWLSEDSSFILETKDISRLLEDLDRLGHRLIDPSAQSTVKPEDLRIQSQESEVTPLPSAAGLMKTVIFLNRRMTGSKFKAVGEANDFLYTKVGEIGYTLRAGNRQMTLASKEDSLKEGHLTIWISSLVGDIPGNPIGGTASKIAKYLADEKMLKSENFIIKGPNRNTPWFYAVDVSLDVRGADKTVEVLETIIEAFRAGTI